MKKILGLDLGTNSIGWALVEQDFEKKEGQILGLGSRIIPMSQDILDTFGKGQSLSQTADRTRYRGVRRLRQRHLLRRERLHRVLRILGFLPAHYSDSIDFEKRLGQFKDKLEPNLSYKLNDEGKYEFIFQNSFQKMADEFNEVGQSVRIPYDWTIYYLRKTALESQISLQELAWILLNFNQKRGCYQLREEEEDKSKLVEFHSLKVLRVDAEAPNPKGDIWYNVHLENGWIYRRKSNKPIDDWIGKKRDFIVTTPLDESGNLKLDKEGNVNRSFRSPKEDDWALVKVKTQNEIEVFNKTNRTSGVASYIYDNLLRNPYQKINGKLIRTVERQFYKDELKAILDKQKEFHPELSDNNLLEKCVLELYPNNYSQQNILKQKDFTHFFVNDIIFYQRPLKSKKSLIEGCKYEVRPMKNEEGNLLKDDNGQIITRPIKVIHKSHPYYQEFRLWQFVDNIRIYEREKYINGKLKSDVDVTLEFINDEKAKGKLFDFFNEKAKIKQKAFLANYKNAHGKKLSEDKYRWNYVEDKEYPLNDTRSQFISRLKKVKGVNWIKLMTKGFEIRLWHIIYSVKDKNEYEKALKTFAIKNDIDVNSFVDAFKKFKPFTNDYGALSEKAIKRLLPLMRIGKEWSFDAIDDNTKDRIEKIQTGEYDEKIRNRVRDKVIDLNTEKDFSGLPLWLASYIVYDRHSENIDNTKWETPAQLNDFLKEFKQHSLRNPIVEQVITETLRVVKDIWVQYGNGKKDFFDEIHVELGREMKNPADKRKYMTDQNNKNQDTNERIRALLREFKEENMEGVLPHSPSQQEKLKIFEEDILNQYTEKELDQEVLDGVKIARVAKLAEPTAKEVQKYKLWLEQKYRSPYTGNVIPLSKLFTRDFEIEHVIPQARYFDNSLGNKVICETEVNKTKGNQTAVEFIGKNPGRKIELGQGKTVTLFDLESYQSFVSQNFKTGSKKSKILLSEDVPEQFISRQMNDTRYISKVVKSLLSNLLWTDDEQEATSKKLISVTGGVTTILKNDWGLNNKWNEIILPRFKRLNDITKSNDFTYFSKEHNIEVPDVPKELKKGFNKKRIDHRHHAMDALVVALATRNHVSYLGNEHSKSDNKRYDLRDKLRRVEDHQLKGSTVKVSKEFFMPWKDFPIDAKIALDNIIVSFKQNLRVINKASNKYQVRKKDKIEIKTQEGTNWAIRKPMHEETISGKVNLPWLQLKRGNIATATRKQLDKSFNLNKIKKITDTGIQKILINYLTQEKFKEYNSKGEVSYNTELAFSCEGVEDLNKNIVNFNNGKHHQPIYKVRVYEEGSGRFILGEKGQKRNKYVQGAPNLFYGIYTKEELQCKGADWSPTKRCFETVPLNIVIERLKQGLSPVPEENNIGEKRLFHLSPGDLVYVPTKDENLALIDFKNLTKDQLERLYNVNDFSSTTCYFTPNRLAKAIREKEVDMNYDEKRNRVRGSFDSKTASLDGVQIKESCIKLKVDRLGNIHRVGEY